MQADEPVLATAAKDRLERLDVSAARHSFPKLAIIPESSSASGPSDELKESLDEVGDKLEEPVMGGEEEGEDEGEEGGEEEEEMEVEEDPRSLVPESRDGARYSGVYGRCHDLRKKLFREHLALISSNPAAFQEDAASQADAKLR